MTITAAAAAVAAGAAAAISPFYPFFLQLLYCIVLFRRLLDILIRRQMCVCVQCHTYCTFYCLAAFISITFAAFCGGLLCVLCAFRGRANGMSFVGYHVLQNTKTLSCTSFLSVSLPLPTDWCFISVAAALLWSFD